MRKTIVVGLGLALSLAGTVAAQQPADSGRAKVEGRRGPGGAGGRFEGRRGPGDGFLFREITLTDAQKAQLKQLRESERTAMDAKRDEKRKQFDEVRAARQRGDTAAARAIMQRNRQAMEQDRERHIVAVRNILTAEQRVQFDKNVAEMKQRQAQRGERFGPKRQRGERGGRGVGR
jgi:protein CpxP